MSTKGFIGAVAVVAGVSMTAAVGVPERSAEAPVAELPAVEALAPTRLEVDISEREMYLYHDGDLVNTYAVAVGEPEYPTPKGDFEIDRVEWNPDWIPPNTEWGNKREKKDPNDEDNPMVGAKLFFEYPDYYIHGTDATHTLGEAESHGCIRMDPQRVKELAEWVQKHGGESRSEGWFDRVKANDETEHVVELSDPIPIDIHG